MQRRGELDSLLTRVDKLTESLADVDAALELVEEGEDEEFLVEAKATLKEVAVVLEKMELQRMLGGEHDPSDAILSINAGAGGTDSQDWANMLLRMYLRYCEKKGWKTDLTDLQSGEEAGIKSATFTVAGEYAYGMLKAEVGIHRLVRISPFNAAGKRQTSFSSVFVLPRWSYMWRVACCRIGSDT